MSEAPNAPVPVEYLARVTEIDPVLTSLSPFYIETTGQNFNHFCPRSAHEASLSDGHISRERTGPLSCHKFI